MDSSTSSHESAGEPYDVARSPFWPSIVTSTLAVSVPNVMESNREDGDPGPAIHGRQGGVGVLVAACFIVAEIAGAGILNLPASIVRTG